MPSLRIRISVSLTRDLVASVDQAAHAESRSRSAVLESWLRRAANEATHRELQESTVAYYARLTREEAREEAAMAAALSKAARRVDFDESRPRILRRRRR